MAAVVYKRAPQRSLSLTAAPSSAAADSSALNVRSPAARFVDPWQAMVIALASEG